MNFKGFGPVKEHSLRPYNGNLHEGPLSAVGAPELKYQVTHKYIPTEANELPLELGDVVEVVPNEYSLVRETRLPCDAPPSQPVFQL